NYQEGFKDVAPAHLGKDREHDRNQTPAGPREAGGETESDHIDASDVDATDLSQLTVLGGRPDRLADLGVIQKEKGSDRDEQSEAERYQARFGYGYRAEEERTGQKLNGRVVGSPGHHRHVGNENGKAEGED